MANGGSFWCEIDDGVVCQCKYCGAEILWATTQRNKHIPLEVTIVSGWAESHFGNCLRAA
jgi:hypothetical protein